MLHFKLKGLERRSPSKHMFCPYTQPRPLGLGRKVKHVRSECGHVAYQIKGKEVYTNIIAQVLTLHTTLTSGSGWKVRYKKMYR